MQWPTAVRGLRHAWKCGPWGRLGSLSVTPPPPPPPLAPLCSRLSRCPVRSGPAVKPCSVAGTAGVFQVTSLSQPPPSWGAHRSGFPSRSAAGPQEALLTQGSALSVSGHGRQGEGPEAYRQPRGGLHPSCPRSSLARTDLTACDPAVPAGTQPGHAGWLSLGADAWLLPFLWVRPQLWSGGRHVASLPRPCPELKACVSVWGPRGSL